jgi:hypothetical protein
VQKRRELSAGIKRVKREYVEGIFCSQYKNRVNKWTALSAGVAIIKSD